MATKTKTTRRVKDSYFGLVMEFPLVSIKSEAQRKAAQAIIDRLLKQRKMDDGEEMYLDALSDLVGAYEDVHYPIGPASDADMLRHLMDAKRITQAELHRRTGIPKSTISASARGEKAVQPLDDSVTGCLL